MCEVFGKIVSTKAIIDNETGKCKGYGFVDFDTALKYFVTYSDSTK